MSGLQKPIDTIPEGFGEQLQQYFTYERASRVVILREMAADELDQLSLEDLAFMSNFERSQPDASHLDAVPDGTQVHSGLANARNEGVADGTVLGYSDGATELMTPQTQPATEAQAAPQIGSQLRQEGVENA